MSDVMAFPRFAQTTEQVTEQVESKPPNKSGLSWDQVGIWFGLSAKQQIALAPLLALKLVAMTIPDKPNSSKQRYRLTEQGRALREEVNE